MSVERSSQAFVDFANLEGLNTKTNPDFLKTSNLTECKNADFFTEYGSTRRALGNSRVLSSKIEEGGSGAPISWIGFYRSQNFAGQLVRETLIQAGSKLFQLNGTSVTQLATGQPSGLFRSHTQFGRFLLIGAQDPFITGTLGDRYKFDGFKLSTWGVEAPGNVETIIESFAGGGFTTSRCTVATESSIAYSGNSLKLTKNSGENSCHIQKIGMAPFSININVEDRARMYVYIPEDMHRKLAVTGRCFSVYFSSTDSFGGGAAEQWVRYDFRIGQLLKGWNTLSFDFTLYPAGDLGESSVDSENLDNDNLTAMKYEWFFNTDNTADEIIVYLDNLVSLDQGAPKSTMTDATGSVFSGGSTQVWSHVVTYVNEDGYESNRGVSQESEIYGDASEADANVAWTFEDETHPALTYVGTNDNQTLDPDNKTQGYNSIQFGLDNAVGDEECSIAIPLQEFDFSDAEDGYLYVDVWIAIGDREKLATDGVRVQIGDADLDNYYEWRFDRSSIEEGAFTTLSMPLENPDSTEGVVDLSVVDNVKIIFWFIDDDQSTGTGALKVDNLRIDSYSDYASMELTEIPVSDDPAIVKRNIYRTIANGTTHFYVGTINDNTTTTFTDTVSDGALGTSQPPQPAQFFDSSVPPNAGIIKTWKRTVFMAGDPKDPNVLYFSADDNPEAFPLINAFELDSPITGIFETRNGLIITTDLDYWRVIGDNPDYYVDKVMRNMGNVGFRACGESKLYGWAHDRESIRLYDLQDTNRFSEPIGDLIAAVNKENIEHAWTIYSKSINRMLVSYQNSSGVYDTMYSYQHGQDDIRTGWWTKIDFPVGLEFLCGEEIEDPDGDRRLYVGGADGMLYEFLTGGNQSWVDADGTETAITMELQSIYMRAAPLAAEISGVTGRWKPSFIEIRSRAAGGAEHSYTVRFDTADGSATDQTVRESKTLTFTFPAGVNIQRYRIKDMTSAEYGRINIQCNDLNKDVYFQGARIFIETRPHAGVISKSVPAGRS